MTRSLLAFLLTLAAPGWARTLTVASPDGGLAATLSDEGGYATWALAYRGEPVFRASGLGLELSAGGRLGPGLRVTAERRTRGDATWRPVAGKAATVADRYNGVDLDLAEPGGRRLTVRVRVYDDGFAFRYVLPPQPGLDAVSIAADNSRFQFADDFRCLGLNIGRFGTSHEGEFDWTRPSLLRQHNLYDRPFVCETPKGAGLAITEADLADWAGMYLKGDSGGAAEAVLSPRLDDPTIAVRTRIGHEVVSPWRVVMVARTPGALAESSLVQTLNPPSEIADTRWIVPGKTAWDWWNGPALKAVARPGMDMPTLERFIDFAGASGFRYMLVDEGWYMGAGGGGTVRPGVDVTTPIAAIDMPKLVAYARARGVGLFLWLNWRALDAQFDAALDRYAEWGIAGLKVDFMDRDDQAMVDWYHRLLRATARRRLMLDLHGAFPPTGLERTWPNLMTAEGVMGAEYNKFSRRVTAGHDVRLAYTRNLLGPTDYTPGGFANVAPAAFAPRNVLPLVQHTRAHGLALYVVYDSPFAVAADSPDRYAGSPAGFDLLKAVPTSWDETRFVAGTFGETIAIARRRGREWWVGALAGDAAARLDLPLAFLGPGRFAADIRQDGAAPDALAASRRTVTRSDTLPLALAATGGAVVRLTPAAGGARR